MTRFFLFCVAAGLTCAQIGRPKEPKRKDLKDGVKHKRCKGCNEPGHNLKTCVNVDLDMVYAKLTKGRDTDAGPAASESDDKVPSSDGEAADDDLLVAAAPAVPETQAFARP